MTPTDRDNRDSLLDAKDLSEDDGDLDTGLDDPDCNSDDDILES